MGVQGSQPGNPLTDHAWVLVESRPDGSIPAMKFLLAFLRKLLGRPDPKPMKRILSRWTPI